MRIGLRYDMRSPAMGAGPPALWGAVVDQCAWADGIGAETVLLGEHHGDDDGYNPAPMVLAAAILGRTRRVTVHLSALVVPLHDPVRLAEDLAALSLLGDGRMAVTLGMGYRPHEYAMFGVDAASRRRRLDEAIEVLTAAWRGDTFEYRGRSVRVRPIPADGKAPLLYVGGSTEAAARRAARAGLGFQPGVPPLWDVYVEELGRLGRPVPAAAALQRSDVPPCHRGPRSRPRPARSESPGYHQHLRPLGSRARRRQHEVQAPHHYRRTARPWLRIRDTSAVRRSGGAVRARR